MLFLDDGRRPLNERTSVSAIIEFSGRVTEASVSKARKISCCKNDLKSIFFGRDHVFLDLDGAFAKRSTPQDDSCDIFSGACSAQDPDMHQDDDNLIRVRFPRIKA